MMEVKKILVVTMTMGFGGAETHIIELCAGLKNNGIEIIVVSNREESQTGKGLFVTALEEIGVETIFAPLNSRRISDIIKSGRIIERAICEFSPDAVHAHARIPALAAKPACKKIKIPLITTGHGTYKVSPLLKAATHWGDYQMCVSDDIQSYLVKNYGAKKGSIIKTVNGINTDVFSCGINDPKMRSELGIGQDEKIILTVSRLDRESSFAAAKLCAIAPKIREIYPASRIVIVGDGDYFQTVRDAANRMNETLGGAYIIMTGARNDIWRYVSGCDVFVGISRAALESLSCGKPTVLLGDMGYLGVFTEDKSEIAVETNFTCRGCGYPSDADSALFNDILYCLDSKNAPQLEKTQVYSSALVRERYSVQKMTADALYMYKLASVRYKNPDFTLTGFYGHDNIGDDALLFTVLNSVREKNKFCKVCVLSRNPAKMQKRLDEYFPNVEVLSRFNPFHLGRALKNTSALVFGGGTLLQDTTSTKSLMYYLHLLKTARKYDKKTILYANGIDVKKEKNKLRVYEALTNITSATTRDAVSYEILREMEIDNRKYEFTADEAVKITSAPILNSKSHDFKKFIGRDYFVVSVRKWKGVDSQFFAALAAAVENISREYGLMPVYAVMEPKNDRKVADYLATLNSNAYVVDTDGDIGKMLAVTAQATAVVAMRLHTLVFAAACGVPSLGISYDRKVEQFITQIYGGATFALPIVGFSKNVLLERFRILMDGHDHHGDLIKSAMSQLQAKAARNAEIFAQVMGWENCDNAQSSTPTL